MSTVKIAVIGGDRRQSVLAALLAEDGFECAVFGLDGVDIGSATRCADIEGAIAGTEAVILPLPVSRNGKTVNSPLYAGEISIKELHALVPLYVPFLGGMIKQKDFPDRTVRDYYKEEELQILNTVPTAEGAVAIAMNELSSTINGTSALIMGFGRVGKTLGLVLRGLGATVTVATRNPTEHAVCEILGFNVAEHPTLAASIGTYGLIFNTIPAVLLTEELLENVADGTPVIDLATHPGGVDASAAERLGKNVIWALGLPGKVAPVTAGKYIKKTVCGILKEERII